MCVYAVGMGYVDVCVGSFRISAERSRLTHFIHIYDEPVVLLAKQLIDRQSNMWDDIYLPFRPFQPELWFALLVCVAVLALLMAWHESGPGGSFHGDPWWKAIVESTF